MWNINIGSPIACLWLMCHRITLMAVNNSFYVSESAAFNTVDRNVLFSRLKNMLPEIICSWYFI